MLDKFADELRAKREESGISLEHMANKTRIDKKFLEAIDEGNFAFLPELYVKAFIKQYAKMVGLDETETLKRFESAKKGRPFEQEDPVAEPDESKENKPVSLPSSKTESQHNIRPLKSYHDPSIEKRQVENDEPGKDRLLIISAVAGILVILVAVYIFFIRDSKEIIVSERPFEEVIQENQQRYVEQPPAAIEDSLVTASDSLFLTFMSSESSWIFIVIDDLKTEEFTLAPNGSHTITAANNFKATVGNSGGVKLTLNDQPVEFSGRTGSVRHFSLDRQGLKYLNTPPKLDR